MRFATVAGLLTLLQYVAGQAVPAKDHVNREYFAVEADGSLEALLEAHPGWQFEHAARGLENHYVVSRVRGELQPRDHELKAGGARAWHELVPHRLSKRMPIREGESAEQLAERAAVKKSLEISDPLFDEQWHLLNTRYPGNDMNVTGLWQKNITGHGIVVAVVDDGLDYESEDLKDNFCAEGSWDFNSNSALPKPMLRDDTHGTRCAGEIAAAKNQFCGLGVAYNSKVSGIRILSEDITPEDEAASLVYGLQVNDIYSCSWGPTDNGKELQAPSDLVKKAIIRGVTEGRNQKGALYVFASGNGGALGDNCNYDGYTNSIYSITVSAIDHRGIHPTYAESCSAVLVVAHSSGSGNYIRTTDVGGQCSGHHGGTSAAAPLAAGVYALLLEANPNLTWRDVQYLTIKTSIEVNPDDSDWQEGSLGRRYSHKYGYGKLDAYSIVEAAKSWKNVNPQTWYYHPTIIANETIGSPDVYIESNASVSRADLDKANFKRVEHITVTVDIESTIRGYTTVDLVAPNGHVSRLGVVRKNDKSIAGFKNWTFMSVAHWGYSGEGDWRLQVRTTSKKNTVHLKGWRLKLFGESIDASKAVAPEFGNDQEEPDDMLTGNPDQSASPTPTPSNTSTSQDELNSGASKIVNTHHAKNYYLMIFIVGAVILVLYFFVFSKTRRIRRSRAEAFEFDIIDTDSEYDSTVDNHDPTARMLSDNDLNDFDFDLSDLEAPESPSESGSATAAPHSKNDRSLSTIAENPFEAGEEGLPQSEQGANDKYTK
ncbi:AaceriABL203Wp [[Ashbya] aceris (nom. inval.)]|nr:AaceriABL203Wp [[Ashbya] aceris (nom. inval.)]